MTDERTLRTAAAARECGADWAIVTAIDAVAYATGHVAVIEAGPSPFNGGPAALAVIGADGTFGLVVNQLERGGADATGASVVRSYESLGFSDQRPLPEKYLEESTALFQELGVGGTVAVERTAFPHALAEALPGARFVAIDEAMGRARRRRLPTRSRCCANARASPRSDTPSRCARSGQAGASSRSSPTSAARWRWPSASGFPSRAISSAVASAPRESWAGPGRGWSRRATLSSAISHRG